MAITIPENLPAKEILNHNSVIGLSFESLQHCRITQIECFRFDSELSKKLLIEHSTDYVCGLIAISTKTGACGLREFAIPWHRF